MKHFIAVIGVSGAGKSTFIANNFKDLPLDYIHDDSPCPMLFHDKIMFEKAVLEITSFENVYLDILLDHTIKKGHTLEVYYIFLDNVELHKSRIYKRSGEFKKNHMELLDVHEYAYSKNVFDRTKQTMQKFIANYGDKIKFHLINNSKEVDTE